MKFKRGPKFSRPSLHLHPGYYGKCTAAGWTLSMSKIREVQYRVYELHFQVGNNRQCQPFFEESAEQLPRPTKEGYKKNKICSLLSNVSVKDGDVGGPLICNNRLQGIISHYYKRLKGLIDPPCFSDSKPIF